MRLKLSLPIGRSGLAHQLLATTAGAGIVRVLGMGLTFLVGVQLARLLGPKGYGDYGTVMAIVALMIVPAQLGLPQLMTRELAAFMTADSFARVKGAMLWFFCAVLVASFLLAAVGWVGMRSWPTRLDPTFCRALSWGVVAIPFTACASLCVAALRGFHHVLGAQIYDALIRPFFFAALIWVAAASSSHMDAGTALLLQALAAVATLAICSFHLAYILPKAVRQARSTSHSGLWVASALPMAGTEVLRVLDGQYAVLLLGFLTTLDQVGVFRIAVASATFLGLPGTILNIVIMPYVATFHAAGARDKLQKVVFGSTLAMFLSVTGMTLCLAFVGRCLIAEVFGAPFAPAALPLTLMGVAFSVNGFFGSAATLLNMCNRERTVTWVYVIGPSIGICATCLTFRWLGISAAAVALIVSETVKGIIMWREARQRLGVDPSMLGVLSLLIRRAQRAHAQASYGAV